MERTNASERHTGKWSRPSLNSDKESIVWWVLGALILMPLMLDMGNMVFVIGGDQWMSLVGHLIFGVVTGLVFLPLNKRS